MFIHPSEVEDVVSELSGVSKFQVTVGHAQMRDSISARFELEDETVDKKALADAFKKDFQSRCRLKVDTIEFVPAGTIPDDAQKLVDARKEIIL